LDASGRETISGIEDIETAVHKKKNNNATLLGDYMIVRDRQRETMKERGVLKRPFE
jgi:hypothetical protein